MPLRVEQGKGRKGRNAMLSPQLLELLRDWWWAGSFLIPRARTRAGVRGSHAITAQRGSSLLEAGTPQSRFRLEIDAFDRSSKLTMTPCGRASRSAWDVSLRDWF